MRPLRPLFLSALLTFAGCQGPLEQNPDDGGALDASVPTDAGEDPAAPVLALTSPADGASIATATLTVAGTITAEAGLQAATVQLDDATPVALTVTDGAFSTSLPVELGAHTITVRATDTRTREVSASRAFTRVDEGTDVAPPTLDVQGPEGALLLTYTATLRGTANDDVGVTSAELLLPNGSTEALTLGADGSFTRTFKPVAGQNVVTVRVKDAAGNTTEKTVRFDYSRVLSAGTQHTGHLRNGTLLVWGRDHLGQLGLGPNAFDGGSVLDGGSTTIGVPVPGLSQPVSLGFGGISSLVVTRDGKVFGWGDNGEGQLGLGASADGGVRGSREFAPREVLGVTDAVSVVSGLSHALVLRRDGTVLGFGANSAGQLGDGTSVPRSVPAPVVGLTDVVQLGGASASSIALTADGSVYTFGTNADGNLGIGSEDTMPHPTPTKVPGLTGVVQVAAGKSHFAVLLSDGTVKTWGLNASGQLGNGTEVDASSPVAVTGLTGVVEIGASGNMTFARLASGTMMGWGQNGNGSLGAGDIVDKAVPTAVKSLTGVRQMAVGNLHGTALDDTNAVWSWGWNFRGTLGGGPALRENWAYPEAIQVQLP